ncbi:MAG: aspartate--tRNA ligase [Candidatus Vogelbacteria bacterium]|nr:aspartate--tRNA ligase [Candidatus Vogelbacteria bacterium]
MERVFIGDLTLHTGKEVHIRGWVDVRRDHGKLIFLDIRDMSGKVQAVLLPSHEEAKVAVETFRSEWVVEIVGNVNKRPEKLVNANEKNGSLEIEITKATVINKAETTPIDVNSDGLQMSEEVRLKYRYLDLRRERMTRNMRVRSQVIKFFRDYLINKERFVEIETPILTKTTPEGARDFLVPARLSKGNFYALPQSPQQYKQLLMVAGFERYFQIARCFRDEDPRADRAYGEFTQLDMEMSFASQEEIMQLTEKMFTEMVESIFPEKHIMQKPWPRLTHKEAKEKFGTDKPDLRKNKEDQDELAFAWTVDFPLFTEQSEEDFFHGSGKSKFAPSHHMFTAPHPDDIGLLETDPTKVRGLQHDLVLNGYEVGGGSVRIHQSKIQEKVFDLIGFNDEQKKQFAHMLEAFTYGVPPHGGIAPGIDRLLMVILGEQSVREVIAFPMTGNGKASIMEAPSVATDEQLTELGIRTIEKNK